MWHRKNRPLPPASIEATAARISAERDLEQRLDDITRVKALLAEWNRIRERNGLAEALERSMRRRHA